MPHSSSSRSPAWVMPLVVAWFALAALWFVSPLFPMKTLTAVQRATSGWLSVTLVASFAVGAIGVAIVLRAGQQRLRDIGLRRGDLPAAVLATAVLWLLMQSSTVLAAGASGLEIAPAWSSGAGRALGPLLAQVLGTALMEELVFRGYLWPQLARHLETRWSRPRACLVALLASQATFALMHIPVLAYRGMDGGAIMGALLMLLVAGLYFALLYALTRNLLFAVGAHALANATTPLFAPQGPAPTLVLAAGAIVLAVAWRLRSGSAPRSRRSARARDPAAA